MDNRNYMYLYYAVVLPISLVRFGYAYYSIEQTNTPQRALLCNVSLLFFDLHAKCPYCVLLYICNVSLLWSAAYKQSVLLLVLYTSIVLLFSAVTSFLCSALHAKCEVTRRGAQSNKKPQGHFGAEMDLPCEVLVLLLLRVVLSRQPLHFGGGCGAWVGMATTSTRAYNK